MADTHARALIRANIVAMITAAGTAAGDRVYPNRVLPLHRQALPAIVVFTTGEDAGEPTSGPLRVYPKTVDVVVAIYAAGGELDDNLDAMCLAVERAIAADESCGGIAAEAVYTKTEFKLIDGGDVPLASAEVHFAVSYLGA